MPEEGLEPPTRGLRFRDVLALHGRLRGLGDMKGDTTADSAPTAEPPHSCGSLCYCFSGRRGSASSVTVGSSARTAWPNSAHASLRHSQSCAGPPSASLAGC